MAQAHKFTKRTLVRPAKFETREVLVTPAKFRTGRVKTHDAVYVKRKQVRLTISMEEAEALRAVLSRIGGDPVSSRRGYTQAIVTALGEAGVKYELGDGFDLRAPGNIAGAGGLLFLERTNIHIPSVEDYTEDYDDDDKQEVGTLRKDR